MDDQATEKRSWWQRLSGGLKRTSAGIGTAISDLVVKRKLDQAMLDEIEEVLIRAARRGSRPRWARAATTRRSRRTR
jgi:fused signal recognition particle receptor